MGSMYYVTMLVCRVSEIQRQVPAGGHWSHAGPDRAVTLLLRGEGAETVY